MPNNIKGLKASLRRGSKAQANSIAASLQKTMLTIILEEIAKKVPIDKGPLHGNFVVTVGRQKASFIRTRINKSRKPSTANLAIVDRLDGNFSVSVVNKTPYSEIVEAGLNGNDHNKRFFKLAIQAAENRIQAKGIRAKPT